MKKFVATLTLLALLTACGGGGGGRPSTDEIAKSLKGKDNALSSVTTGASDDVVNCIAKALHDSDLSDDALQALVDGDDDYKGSKDDEKAITDVTSDLTKCATA